MRYLNELTTNHILISVYWISRSSCEQVLWQQSLVGMFHKQIDESTLFAFLVVRCSSQDWQLKLMVYLNAKWTLRIPLAIPQSSWCDIPNIPRMLEYLIGYSVNNKRPHNLLSKTLMQVSLHLVSLIIRSSKLMTKISGVAHKSKWLAKSIAYT